MLKLPTLYYHEKGREDIGIYSAGRDGGEVGRERSVDYIRGLGTLTSRDQRFVNMPVAPHVAIYSLGLREFLTDVNFKRPARTERIERPQTYRHY